MDNDRRPRQSTGYASQQGTLLQPQTSYPVVSASDRFRQAPLTAQPPTSAGPTTPSQRSAISTTQSYGYAYEGPSQFVQQPAVGQVAYSPSDYADTPPQPAAQRPQYSQYPASVMYNVPSQSSQASSSPYEGVPQYQQNRDSAIEVLGTNFGVAQSTYYGGVPTEGGPTSAPSSAMAQQSVPSQYSSIAYSAQQATAPAYSAAMTDPHPTTTQGPYSHPTYAQPQQHDGSSTDYDDFYQTYQTELKKTFIQIRDGRLAEAAPALDRLSEWLLHWAETLGLVRDEEAQYQQRLKLWEEFNHCWLALFQRQYEMVEDSQSAGQRPQSPQSLIEYDFIEKMGTKLVKNCDNMEKHGLVDYQMGVWEEEITAMAMKCMEQLEALGAGPSAPRPSASGSRRR